MQTIPLTIAPTPPDLGATSDERIENAVLEIREQLGHIFDPVVVLTIHPASDWSDAESQVITSPPVLLEEDQQHIVLRVAIPGVECQYVHVFADSSEVLVEVHVGETHFLPGLGHQVEELTIKRLARTFRFPEAIDLRQTEACLEGCILTIRAKKLNAPLPADAFLP